MFDKNQQDIYEKYGYGETAVAPSVQKKTAEGRLQQEERARWEALSQMYQDLISGKTQGAGEAAMNRATAETQSAIQSAFNSAIGMNPGMAAAMASATGSRVGTQGGMAAAQAAAEERGQAMNMLASIAQARHGGEMDWSGLAWEKEKQRQAMEQANAQRQSAMWGQILGIPAGLLGAYIGRPSGGAQ